jgi:hypothetical protein
LEQAPSIYRGGGRKVGRFKRERLVMGRHSTLLSREEYGVAASALFYKIKERNIAS